MMIQNKVVVGKINDEAPGNAIKEFVGLKTKIYSFLIDDSIERKQLKGLKKKCCCNNNSWRMQGCFAQ